MRRVKFQNNGDNTFIFVLNKRVNDYFKLNAFSKQSGTGLIFKITFLLFLFFGLYVILVSNRYSTATTLLLVILFGISNALIGFNIAHDALHGALFKSRYWNKFFGYTFELIGMSSYTWYLKHNIVHHNNPNVQNADFDIEAAPLLRLSPADKLLFYHRYQHLYAPLVYMLLSLVLIFYNDFVVVFNTNRKNIDGKSHSHREKVKMILSKVLYIFFFLIFPVLLLHVQWWAVLLYFLLMHATVSLLMAFILIPSHLFEHTHFPLMQSDGKIDNDWAIHQMQTTVDYGRKSRLCNFLFGGFNINVAHHLFPRICHVHLIEVSEIIKLTAAEFEIAYHEKTFVNAIVSHFKILKQLGNSQQYQPYPVI